MTLPQRSLPICYLSDGIVDYERKQYAERKGMAAKWKREGKTIAPHAEEVNKRLDAIASTKHVEIVESNDPEYKARVSRDTLPTTTGYIEVSVDLEWFKGECPCLLYKEEGIYCSHVKAVLQKLSFIASSTDWNHKRYNLVF